jgi:hypothetical protein
MVPRVDLALLLEVVGDDLISGLDGVVVAPFLPLSLSLSLPLSPFLSVTHRNRHSHRHGHRQRYTHTSLFSLKKLGMISSAVWVE